MEKLKTSFDYHYRPLTTETWADFVHLFGERGASSGCWCMWSRAARKKDFEDNRGEGNKAAMKELVASGQVTGLIGYADDQPIGWCSLGPREDFPRLERTRNLKKVDDRPVWSIICLFVVKEYRRRGVTKLLIESAIDYASSRDVAILEAYPADPEGETIAAFVETGFKTVFDAVGFKEVARRGKRPIMRYKVQSKEEKSNEKPVDCTSQGKPH